MVQQFVAFHLNSATCRSLKPAVLDVSLGTNPIGKLMLDLELLSHLALQLCLGQWKQPRIMLRIILPWHDGG